MIPLNIREGVVGKNLQKVPMSDPLYNLKEYYPSLDPALSLLEFLNYSPDIPVIIKQLEDWLLNASKEVFRRRENTDSAALNKWIRWHDQLQECIVDMIKIQIKDEGGGSFENLTDIGVQFLEERLMHYDTRDEQRERHDVRPFKPIRDRIAKNLSGSAGKRDSDILFNVINGKMIWKGKPSQLASVIFYAPCDHEPEQEYAARTRYFSTYIEYGDWQAVRNACGQIKQGRALSLPKKSIERICRVLGDLTGHGQPEGHPFSND
jgi:hypothetical protein